MTRYTTPRRVYPSAAAVVLMSKNGHMEVTHMFKKNVGSLDAKIRLTVGAIALVAGVFVLGALQGSVVGLIALLVSAIALVTGTTRFCPTYALLGIDTLEKDVPEVEPQGSHA